MQTRRVLLLDRGNVAFTQSGYLHLFAAKRALKSTSMFDILMSDPLYFSPIVVHYAALKRDDAALASSLFLLFNDFSQISPPTAEIFFDISNKTRTLASAESIQEEVNTEAAAIASTPVIDTFDREPGEDYVPFPLDPVDGEPTVRRLIATLALCSSVLRDTDTFDDRDTRRQLLIDLLIMWRRYVDLVSDDEDLIAMARQMAEQSVESSSLPPPKVELFVDDFARLFPIATAMGGISSTLSSSKLARLVDRLLDDHDLMQDPGVAAMTVFLASDINKPGWPEHARSIFVQNWRSPAFNTALRRILLYGYLSNHFSEADNIDILEMLSEQTVTLHDYPDKHARNAARGRILQALRAAKMNFRLGHADG